MVKLTDGQYNVLLQAVQEYGVSAAEHYPPIKKLLALGLIEARKSGISTRYHATDAGRAALEQEERR